MSSQEIQAVAGLVLRKARASSFVTAKEIRAELRRAELPEDAWKEIVELLRESLNYRRGRYYALHSNDSAEGTAQSATEIQETSSDERRRDSRRDFDASITVIGEDGREIAAQSQNVSATGIGFTCDRSLIGRKLTIILPEKEGGTRTASARVVWTSAIADGVWENGAAFVGAAPQEESTNEESDE